MNLQHSILERFREQFPTASFKDISKITGLQSTRIFRLYNGYEMKLKEYAIFENLLAKKACANVDQELLGLTRELLLYLPIDERRHFHLYLQREIYKNELKYLGQKKELRRQYV